jgi:signal transduction histidine kinase
MTARRDVDWIYQAAFYLAAGLIYVAVLMRSFLLYRDTPVLAQLLALLLLFMGLFLAEMALARRGSGWFHAYLGLQTILTSLLMYGPEFDEYDYFSLLFAILGMQVMRQLGMKAGLAWILAFFVLIGYKFLRFEEPLEGLTRLLLFGSVIGFLASYSLSARRAQEARRNNQLLMQQLQDANQKLEQTSDTLENLGIARERQRLARELHDSVTQTIFSMTLTAQSAQLVLDKDSAGWHFSSRLEHRFLRKRHGLRCIPLSPKLRPAGGGRIGNSLKAAYQSPTASEAASVTLVVDVSNYCAKPRALSVSLAQALNNIIKHAVRNNACLHLTHG